MGVFFGGVLGVVYALVSSVVNRVILTGISLYSPPPGLLVQILLTVLLGAVIGLTQIVKTDSIMKVLETKIPSGFLDMNKKAMDLGLQLAEASTIKQG